MKKMQAVRFLNGGGYAWGEFKPDQSLGIIEKRQGPLYCVFVRKSDWSYHPSFNPNHAHAFFKDSIEPMVLPWPVLLYRAIVGALFGPDNHDRYTQGEEK